MAIAARLTLEEFLHLPEEEPALEFADGEVTQKVSPKGRHAFLQEGLAEILNAALRRKKRGRAVTELRTTFAGASYVPDVSVYRTDRIPTDAAGMVADDFTEPPDVAIEIASPGQSPNAPVRKCQWYVEHGVQMALLFDSTDRSVLVVRRGQPLVALGESDSLDLAPAFPGIVIPLGEVFASLRPR